MSEEKATVSSAVRLGVASNKKLIMNTNLNVVIAVCRRPASSNDHNQAKYSRKYLLTA